MDIVNHWSVTKPDPSNELHITTALFEDAKKLHDIKKPYWGKIKNEKTFLFSSSDLDASDWITLFSAHKKYLEKPLSWEQYINTRFKVYVVTPFAYGLDYFTYTCRIGSKKLPCKHVVVAMVAMNILNFPSATPNRDQI